jgi:competence protein ComEA
MRTQTFLALVLAVFMTPALMLASPQGQEPAAVQKSTINLNTATVDQLMTLPGIGQKTAERILEYRTKSGGFKKIEELMNVKGIGEKSFLKIKPLVSAPPKPDKATGD